MLFCRIRAAHHFIIHYFSEKTIPHAEKETVKFLKKVLHFQKPCDKIIWKKRSAAFLSYERFNYTALCGNERRVSDGYFKGNNSGTNKNGSSQA